MSKESWLDFFDGVDIINILLPEFPPSEPTISYKKNGELDVICMPFTNKKTGKRAIFIGDNLYSSIILQQESKNNTKNTEWGTVAYDTMGNANEEIRKRYDPQDRGLNITTVDSAKCPYTRVKHDGSCVAGAVKVFLQYAGVVDKSGKVVKAFSSKAQEKVYNNMNAYINNPTIQTKNTLLTSVKEVKQELTFCKILERLQSQNEFHKIDIIKFFTKASKKGSVTNPRVSSFNDTERKFSVAFQKACKAEGLLFSNNHKENKHGMRSKSVIDFMKKHSIDDGVVKKIFQSDQRT
jgi:hypothetical protein